MLKKFIKETCLLLACLVDMVDYEEIKSKEVIL